MQYDVVGFQTEGDAGNFIRYLISECNQARDMRVLEINSHQTALSLNGRQTRIGNFPVGIEPRAFQRLARRNVRSPLVKELVASLRGPLLVFGGDRLDYSKGLIPRLHPFAPFLANPPQSPVPLTSPPT